MSETRAQPVRPTKERPAKGGVIENPAERGERDKPYTIVEGIHDELFMGGLISKPAWEAGNVFREVYERANGSGCAAASFERGVDGSHRDVSERQAQAKL